jgi:tRNA A37 threonylcarbamoyladenosine dehydratase
MSTLYDRQDRIEGLKRDFSVTVIGCGGIGFWVAKFLALSGVEKIYLFDPDVIEEHNLARIDLPHNSIGWNKSEITKKILDQLRPECYVISMPYKFQDHTFADTDWIIDCTDSHSVQLENQSIADKRGCKYVKAGYDGESITVSGRVAEWGEAEDGYRVVPSWVVPASIVASLVVAKVMKYESKELSTQITRLFNY